MIGPLTSALLWLAGFWFEILLWSILSLFLYNWLWSYLITRYLVAYPGLILLWNLGGWVFCFCIWFFYMLFGSFYNSFVLHDRSTKDYMSPLTTALLISTIAITFFAVRFIYKEEVGYWKTKK